MPTASSILSQLFARLFRYRQSEARTPTEDFLTELLAYILEMAPQATVVQIIQTCFVPPAMASRFRFLVGEKVLSVRTQVRIPNRKVLDLLIEIDGLPVIVIENKIGAGFQLHQKAAVEFDSSADVLEVRYDHQLMTYSSWLRGVNKPEGWPGVLAVLTHTALAPPDFNASGTHRYGVVPHQCYWRSFHGILRKIVGDDEPVSFAWQFVGREICNFLESNGMSSSDLSSVDIAAVNISMEAGRHGLASLVEVSAELLHRHPGSFVARGHDSEILHAHSRMWGWTFFTGKGKIYLACGICFVPLVGEPALAVPPLPDQEHAFVAVGSDETALRIDDFDIPNGWSRLAEDCLIMKPFPLSDRRSGEHFPQFLLRMIENEFATITVLREAYLSSLPLVG